MTAPSPHRPVAAPARARRRLARASSRRPAPRSERGQASVEVVALLPLVAAIALAAITIAASSVAQEQAGEAAEAAALAILQDTGDPKAAAAKALSRSARRRASIEVTGRRVHVRVRSAFPLPGLADRLAGVARADAGP